MSWDIKDRIRQCAELAGNGDILSQKTGIPRSTLETYLTGKAEPKVSRALAIARAAGVSVEWLASGEGPMRPGTAPSAGAAEIDLERLKAVLSAVERHLGEREEGLDPEDKAELVRVLYRWIGNMKAGDPAEQNAMMADFLGIIQKRA